MKLSLILEVIDKGTRNIRKMTGDVRDLAGRGMGTLARATAIADRRLERMGGGFVGNVSRMTASAARFAGRAGLKAIEKAAHGAGYAIGFTIRKALDLTRAIMGWGALASGALLTWLIGGTISTAAEFEQLQIALEGTEGSAEKAQSAMAWVTKFAKDTPYEIQEVTDAFVRARGVGIDPMTGAMTKLGDAAGGARKSLMDAVEALADAQTGEFERLKEFNIGASVKGDNVTFSYIDKAGKNAEKSVKKSMAAIRDTVLEIFDEKYGGGMLRQSKSMLGIWNNIKDTFTGIQLKVANAGFFDKVKQQLQEVLDWVGRLEKDGTLAKWAQQTSDWLSQAVEQAAKFVKETNWKQLGQDAAMIGRAFWSIAVAIAKIVEAWSRLPSGFFAYALPGGNAQMFGAQPSRQPGDGKPLWDWGGGPTRRGKGPPAVKTPAAASKALPPAKSEIVVKVRAENGTSARVQSTRTSGGGNVQSVLEKRGQAMRGPA